MEKNISKIKKAHPRITENSFIEKLITIRRVTKVTKGGRGFSFSAVVVVGSSNWIGIGIGKAKDAPEAIRKATEQAKKNLVGVNCVLNETIAHEFEAKFGASKVFIKPASEGTGIIASWVVRSLCECMGIKNILSKCKGSSNPMNVARACIEAFSRIRNPREIAFSRGKSLDQIYRGCHASK